MLHCSCDCWLALAVFSVWSLELMWYGLADVESDESHWVCIQKSHWAGSSGQQKKQQQQQNSNNNSAAGVLMCLRQNIHYFEAKLDYFFEEKMYDGLKIKINFIFMNEFIFVFFKM